MKHTGFYYTVKATVLFTIEDLKTLQFYCEHHGDSAQREMSVVLKNWISQMEVLKQVEVEETLTFRQIDTLCKSLELGYTGDLWFQLHQFLNQINAEFKRLN